MVQTTNENGKTVFESAADRMLAAGLSAFPAKRADKFPTGMKWAEFQRRRMTPAEVPQFFRRADAICVICGPVSAIDGSLTVLDFDDKGSRFEPWRAKVEAVNPQLLASLVIERSPSGGYHVGARSDLVIGNGKLAMSADGKTTLIETRGKGGLVVCDPTPGYELVQGTLSTIPTITSGQMEFLIDCARSFDERAPATEAEKPTATTASAPRADGQAGELKPWDDYNARGDFRAVLERHGWRKVRDAIPGDDNERWRRPGKEDKGHSATINSKRRFYVWTTGAEPFANETAYSPFKVYAMLEHGGDFTAAGAALGELGYGNQDHGTDTSAIMAKALTITGADQADQADDDQADDDTEDTQVATDPGPFPADCLRPPGVITDIVDFTLATSIYPQPVLALAGAMATVAVITGRKIRDRRDARTNIQLLVLAPSGAGKKQARVVAKNLLTMSGCSDMIGPDRLSSAAGIVSWLKTFPASLIQPDEFQATIESACHGRNSPHLKHIPEVLKEAYSSESDRAWKPTGLADRKMNIEINQPHLVLHATGVGERFWEACSLELATDGAIGRMLLLEIGDEVVMPAECDATVKPSPELIDKIVWWRKKTGDGNLFDINPEPIVIAESAEAAARRDEHWKAIRTRQQGERSIRAALWSRAGQRSAQLALLFAASRQTGCESMTIERCDWDLAIRINNWSTRKLVWHCEEHMAESGYQKLVNRILDAIPTTGITQSEFTNRTYKMGDRPTRKRILDDLIEARRVEVREVKTKTKPKSLLFRK